MEVEYITYSNAAKKAAWLQQLCIDIKHQNYLLDNKSVLLQGDNQACLMIAKDLEHHGQTKAIDIHYHHIWNLITRNIITHKYIPTKQMLADRLTKALP